MLNTKELKKQFKKEASQNPEKYFPTKILQENGYARKQCECNTFFWTTNPTRKKCGDPMCTEGFSFLKKPIAKKQFTYTQIWQEFSKHLQERGYTPIPKYPVVARWRDDTDFVQASIYNFQPWVVKGVVEPPANPLTVPQFCLRFNDIDNVGITMSHNTGFIMIGQHAFTPKNEFKQDKYFKDLLDWFLTKLEIPKEELTIHEDAWAGGGNFGACMEFFSGGLELGNQVYITFEQTEYGSKELDIKVLDMGMGHERQTWFSTGKPTMYDAVFPKTLTAIKTKLGINLDYEFLKKYTPYASFLNLDEVEDINIAWEKVAKAIGETVEKVKQELEISSAIYSIAEHTRTLLVAINDGALPSNVKGGYNLRTILRRSLNFINKYDWDITLAEIAELHTKELQEIYPEIKNNIEHVKKILNIETQKYYETQDKNQKIIQKTLTKKIDENEFVKLYDSYGITPEEIQKEAKKQGQQINTPENFYTKLTELHEQQEQQTATKKETTIDIGDTEETKILYFDHHDLVDFDAIVIQKIPKNEQTEYIILNETAFYPTSGGQIHDKGEINKHKVINVIKQGKHILHEVEKSDIKKGDKAECSINYDRRMQLAQHHTATHIITGSAREILGPHIWQAGASKQVDKSRIDLTHYQQLSEEELKKIENYANMIVQKNIPIEKEIMKRSTAESQYGIRIYQGGAVPGNNLRIVNIVGFDAEACGGTHLDVTGDVGSIKILKSSKIQDGVIRIEFVAGAAAEKELEKERNIIKKAKEILNCKETQIPARAEELFTKWKQKKKKKEIDTTLTTTEEYEGDIITQTAQTLKTQPEHIIKTLERFMQEIQK